jgi:hypothetical protein
MRNYLATAIIALVVAGCAPVGPGPIAGGPCKYDTSIVKGTVTEVDEDGALLMGEEGAFRVEISDLLKSPAVGDTLTLQHEQITEGTCTPDIYSEISSGD